MTHQPGVYVSLRALFLVFIEPGTILRVDVSPLRTDISQYALVLFSFAYRQFPLLFVSPPNKLYLLFQAF